MDGAGMLGTLMQSDNLSANAHTRMMGYPLDI